MFEGVPNHPDFSRFWSLIERYKVNIFYTAPTAIRALMREGDSAGDEARPLRRCACSARSASRSIPRPGSGTGGWSATSIAAVVDTWWQTETGGIMITTLPAAHDMKPGSAGRPFFGIVPELVDTDGATLDGRRVG